MNETQATEQQLAKAASLNTLLGAVGYAVWQAAECEDTLAHLVVVHLRSAQGIGLERGQDLLAAAQRKTFGQLLRELREAGVVTGDLEQRLGAVVDERNWVVHRAKREHRGILNNDAELLAVLTRLQQLGRKALDVNRQLVMDLEQAVLKGGVDTAVIDEEANRLLAQWGY